MNEFKYIYFDFYSLNASEHLECPYFRSTNFDPNDPFGLMKTHHKRLLSKTYRQSDKVENRIENFKTSIHSNKASQGILGSDETDKFYDQYLGPRKSQSIIGIIDTIMKECGVLDLIKLSEIVTSPLPLEFGNTLPMEIGSHEIQDQVSERKSITSSSTSSSKESQLFESIKIPDNMKTSREQVPELESLKLVKRTVQTIVTPSLSLGKESTLPNETKRDKIHDQAIERKCTATSSTSSSTQLPGIVLVPQNVKIVRKQVPGLEGSKLPEGTVPAKVSSPLPMGTMPKKRKIDEIHDQAMESKCIASSSTSSSTQLYRIVKIPENVKTVHKQVPGLEGSKIIRIAIPAQVTEPRLPSAQFSDSNRQPGKCNLYKMCKKDGQFIFIPQINEGGNFRQESQQSGGNQVQENVKNIYNTVQREETGGLPNRPVVGAQAVIPRLQLETFRNPQSSLEDNRPSEKRKASKDNADVFIKSQVSKVGNLHQAKPKLTKDSYTEDKMKLMSTGVSKSENVMKRSIRSDCKTENTMKQTTSSDFKTENTMKRSTSSDFKTENTMKRSTSSDSKAEETMKLSSCSDSSNTKNDVSQLKYPGQKPLCGDGNELVQKFETLKDKREYEKNTKSRITDRNQKSEQSSGRQIQENVTNTQNQVRGAETVKLQKNAVVEVQRLPLKSLTKPPVQDTNRPSEKNKVSKDNEYPKSEDSKFENFHQVKRKIISDSFSEDRLKRSTRTDSKTDIMMEPSTSSDSKIDVVMEPSTSSDSKIDVMMETTTSSDYKTYDAMKPSTNSHYVTEDTLTQPTNRGSITTEDSTSNDSTSSDSNTTETTSSDSNTTEITSSDSKTTDESTSSDSTTTERSTRKDYLKTSDNVPQLECPVKKQLCDLDKFEKDKQEDEQYTESRITQDPSLEPVTKQQQALESDLHHRPERKESMLKSVCRMIQEERRLYNLNLEKLEREKDTDYYLTPITTTMRVVQKFTTNNSKIFRCRIEGFTCNFCGSEFRSKNELLEHKRQYISFVPSGAYICSRFSKRYCIVTIGYDYVRHRQTIQFKCSHCQKKFNSVGGYSRHCNVCKKDRSYLVSPFVQKCLLDNNEWGFECFLCQKSSNIYSEIKFHECIITRDLPENCYEKPSKAETYPCNKCDKVFKESSDLDTHDTEEHSDTFKCAECDIEFYDANSYTSHRREHVLGERYECKICYKSYSRICSLKKHMDYHKAKIGEKPRETT